MSNWLDKVFVTGEIVYMNSDECKERTSRELVELLSSDRCSNGTGQVIVTELLYRLVESHERKYGA